MRRLKQKPPFASEADLCAAFIEWAKPQGFVAYAETAGWDILLVGPGGTQIGVQAKMRYNLAVLTQAVEDRWMSWSNSGPDFRSVLIPTDEHSDLCDALGLTLIRYRGDWRRHDFGPSLPIGSNQRPYDYDNWHYANPISRCRLPEYVPDVVAGASSPVQLTPWKIKALKIVATLEIRGYVTRKDFHLFGIDHRRWINDNDWLRAGAAPGQFVRGPNLTFPDQHPKVYAEVKADIAAELAKTELLV